MMFSRNVLTCFYHKFQSFFIKFITVCFPSWQRNQNNISINVARFKYFYHISNSFYIAIYSFLLVITGMSFCCDLTHFFEV